MFILVMYPRLIWSTNIVMIVDASIILLRIFLFFNNVKISFDWPNPIIQFISPLNAPSPHPYILPPWSTPNVKTMTARSDFQEHLSKILAAAKSAGFTFEDVIPDEMLNHFQEMEELKSAKQCIKDLESQLEQLSLANSSLLSKLQAKEEESEDQPDEVETLKMEIQQANRRAECWQRSCENAMRHAKTYQQQLKEKAQSSVVDHNTIIKIKCLQADLDQQQALNTKLNQENTTVAALFESLRIEYQNETEEMNSKLRTALDKLKQSKAAKDATEAESEQMSETYSKIIALLESENESAQNVIQDYTNTARDSDKLYAAINSEISPLNAFFSHVLTILDAHHAFFQILLMPDGGKAPKPPRLSRYLDAATESMNTYRIVHAAMQDGGVANDPVRMQLREIASKAGNMYMNIEGTSVMIDRFVKMKGRVVCRRGKRFSFPW